ncbi:arsenate reductase family protein [Pseudoroseicyclus aestuarii]|uniref:Arsenate reductase-like glutaredoxin family protein n=1 Tax=Pseudoroseicyclus aestuarii TaxID=1795041 RepID=A0A318SPY2_9RHOB|nr:ArsC/Spx/MgsR family protein [Pseudoroseicyclus aestuarii]PYE83930.1 arsenate reductase-like glutaredoxin family protein [Pseudoroseicyclus aestuarii]
MRLFGLKTCDSTRKALKTLRERGEAPEFVDVAQGIAPADREAILAALGDKAINRASATWRALDEAERARPPEELLAAHPKLMKRPVIEEGGVIRQGL